MNYILGNGLLRLFMMLCVWTSLQQVDTGQHPGLHLGTVLDNLHPDDYDIVIPYPVDHLGNHLPQAHPSPWRHKRSLHSNQRDNQSSPPSSGTISSQSGEAFHYRIDTSFGNGFHLYLKPNRGLISPEFSVHLRKNTVRNGTVVRTTESWGIEEMCVYVGHVLNHTGSSVAVNLCDGMTGLIHTGSATYLIEPVQHKKDLNSSLPHHHQPHLIYKPSARLPHHSSQSSLKNAHFCDSNSASILDTAFRYREELSSDRRRRKRSASRGKKDRSVAHSLDTLVVVDHKMLTRHGQDNITAYVLTILNVVANLFRDNTIGTKINISLAALILLEGEEEDFEIVHHADKSLSSFCRWQSGLQGVKHDHAILLTGSDICSHSDMPCDTLGFAPIKGMCLRHKSCTINEDFGLGTAFTIAHEAGHNLGMFHDGQNNYCKDYTGCIMAPTLLGQDGMFKWSACSRKYLHKFLRSPQADCLKDKPHRVSALRFPSKLPGELYPADVQCRWQFGPKSRHCVYKFAMDLCKTLWCYTGGIRCETKFLPAAEGTPCAVAKWCRKGECVRYGEDGPPAINGDWSPYSDWSPCTRTCGGGVKYKERRCTAPKPRYGGRDCDGDSRIYMICNDEPCPHHTASFRSVQCSVYDTKLFRGKPYKWRPFISKMDKDEQCKLYCQADKYNFYFAFSPKVVDGTPCHQSSVSSLSSSSSSSSSLSSVSSSSLSSVSSSSSSSLSICIEGECHTAGCDLLVNSGAVTDLCGVCKGDNSTCQHVHGTFQEYVLPHTYHTILTLPAGARNILIEEAEFSPSYLGLKNTRGKYYLTGGWRVAQPGDYHVAGTMFSYRRGHKKAESLSAQGPTDRELIVEVLVQRKTPKINYQFTVPKLRTNSIKVQPPPHNYTWKPTTTNCSSFCGGGERVVAALCLEDSEAEVSDFYCDSKSRPETGRVPCNTEPCPVRWVTKAWSACSKTCRGGTQRRKVLCMQVLPSGVSQRQRKHRCSHLLRPKRKKRCEKRACPPQWHVGNWSQCSTTCGSGVKTRELFCRAVHGRRHLDLPADLCKTVDRPNVTASCQQKSCYSDIQWFLSAWSKCSKTCGPGVQTRKLRCSGKDQEPYYHGLEDSQCDHIPTPSVALRMSCEIQQCRPRWFVSPWTGCSKTCGEGSQTRRVKCMDENTATLSDGCTGSERPVDAQSCQLEECTTAELHGPCVDSFKWCDMVLRYNLCSHPFYGQQCCKSCATVAL